MASQICLQCAQTAESLKKCAVCRSAGYCSADCQKAHWPAHKKNCTMLATGALIDAIRTADTATIERLAKTKRVVNGKITYTPPDHEGAYAMAQWSPLHECIRKDNVVAMQLLIDGGVANLEIRDGDGEPAVFVAATSREPTILATLLRAGANPNAVASDGFSALMMAARDGFYENVDNTY